MKAKPTYFSVQLFQLRLDILLSVARLFLEPFFICDLLVKKLNPSFPSCRAREIFFPSFLSFFLSFLQLTISHPLIGRTDDDASAYRRKGRESKLRHWAITAWLAYLQKKTSCRSRPRAACTSRRSFGRSHPQLGWRKSSIDVTKEREREESRQLGKFTGDAVVRLCWLVADSAAKSQVSNI